MKTNHQSMREKNTQMLINLLKENGPMSKAALSRKTNLAASSVTRLTQELFDDSILSLVDKEKTESAGRKGDLIYLNVKKSVSLIISFNVDKIIFDVSYLDGSFREIRTVDYEKTEGFEKVISDVLDDIFSSNKIGIILLLEPSNLSLRSDLSLDIMLSLVRKIFFDKFKKEIKIKILDQGILALIAEMNLSKDLSVDNNIGYVLINEKVNTGLFLNGQVIKKNGYGYSFGHTTIDIKSKKLCECGNRGCWELYAGVNWLLNEYYGDKIKDEEKFQKYIKLLNKANQESKANELLRKYAYNIAVGIINMVNSLGLDAVVVGGYIYNVQPWVINEIEQIVLSRAIKDNIRIRSSKISPAKVCRYGASFYAIDLFFDDYLKK